MAHSCFGENIQAYEILSPVGKGGFACVYQARCKLSGAEVAIKMIDKQQMKAAGMVERVRQEVRIHSRLKHDSILQLYTFFEDAAAVYLVLELCRGGELAQHVRTRGALQEHEARDYLRQIVEGMLYLHSNKILHRDLSLSNLLLDSRGHTKIADFGLATQLSSPQDRHKTMCGTPNYISPEVATRSWHGMEADVWALGCMLYTMLVGRPPFDTEGVRSTLTRVVMSDVKIPSHLSPEAAGLITGLLKKNPSERLALTAVLQHPFMTRGRAAPPGSCSGADSGMGTLHTSTSGCSADPPVSAAPAAVRGPRPPRVRSLDRALSARPAPQPDTTSSSGGAASAMAQLRRRFEPLPAPARLQLPVPAPPEPPPPRQRESSVERGRSCCQAAGGGHRSWCERRAGEAQSRPCRPPEPEESDVLQGIQPPSAGATPADGAAPPISPLNTRRLKATRQKTKSAVVTLSDEGEVCLEFVRRRQGRECVTDVCRISGDGMRMAVYQPTGGSVPVQAEPPPLPRTGADAFYAYHALPEKYWKKYIYAARFVKLVKAKTAKLTLYTERAKCVLMENGPGADFEVCFYDGSRVVSAGAEVMLSEPGRKPYTVESVGGEQCLSEAARTLCQHFRQCRDHCLQLEAALARLESSLPSGAAPLACFPLIVGRRPSQPDSASSPRLDQENRSPNAQAAAQLRSYEGSVLSTRTAVSAPAGSGRTQRRAHFAGIGTATQLWDGRIELSCEDGTELTVEPRSGGVLHHRADGSRQHYGKHDPLPAHLKRVMQQLPRIVQAIVAGDGARPRRGLRD